MYDFGSKLGLQKPFGFVLHVILKRENRNHFLTMNERLHVYWLGGPTTLLTSGVDSLPVFSPHFFLLSFRDRTEQGIHISV